MSFLGGHRDSNSLGARPIRLPTDEIRAVVEDYLMPSIKNGLTALDEIGEGDAPLGNRMMAQAWIDVPTVKGEILTIKIRVISDGSTYKGDTRAVTGGEWRKSAHEIYVNMNGGLSPRQYLSTDDLSSYMQPMSVCRTKDCLPWGLYSVIAHEMTHAADIIGRLDYDASTTGSIRSGVSVDARRAYVNDPAEVRAFMRQVVDESREAAKLVRRRAKSQQQLISMATGISAHWREIRDYLSPSNRALILKAVYDDLVREGLIR